MAATVPAMSRRSVRWLGGLNKPQSSLADDVRKLSSQDSVRSMEPLDKSFSQTAIVTCGSGITTIKYVQPTTIQKKTDGSMQLQGYGTPGSNYTVQAGTNFLNWLDLGSSLADTNGLFEFTDTNAPFFPQRFYRWFGP